MKNYDLTTGNITKKLWAFADIVSILYYLVNENKKKEKNYA